MGTNYIIAGKVYGAISSSDNTIDRATVQAGVTVRSYNATKDTLLRSDATDTTNTAGEFSIDLANMNGTAFEVGDVIYTIASYNNLSAYFRHIVTAGAGKNQNLYLHMTGAYLSACRIISFFASNGEATAQHAQIFDMRADQPIFKPQMSAGNSVDKRLAGRGFKAERGFAVLYENESLDVEVTIEIDSPR